jgi:hypothetical protein
MIERYASFRGPITWRVWNSDRSKYRVFKTKREAIAYTALGADDAEADGK